MQVQGGEVRSVLEAEAPERSHARTDGWWHRRADHRRRGWLSKRARQDRHSYSRFRGRQARAKAACPEEPGWHGGLNVNKKEEGQ